MPAALFVSPHLDDAVFSAGGTLALMSHAGWEVTVWTVFTASVPEPRDFALRCQTDKGIPPEADYMALRRAEDHAAAVALGEDPARWRHGLFPEAPHRGYDSPAALFAGLRPGDDVWEPIAGELRRLVNELRPALVLAPQGLGNHVDHLQVIRAVLAVEMLAACTAWWRDTPYALREPAARPSSLLPVGLVERAVTLPAETFRRKTAAACAYASQLGFQFGGGPATVGKLAEFHRHEAVAASLGADVFAERLLAPAALALPAPV